ncbi:tetratricopeptide repeat protein [Halopseudomonas pachastrellae]|nr:tetratricopeptide repeat protein [Halopseudomonas pachastrellae]
MSWAEVLWNLYQPEQAWQVLDVAPLDELSPDYWRLRAALAWELERDDAVLSSYKALLAQGAVLLQSEQAQLVDMYRQRDPALALRMQVASWRRTGDTRFLTDALQLAEEQQDWALMETLVAEAMQQPASANLMLVLLARGLLAERAGQFAEAERLYLQGLSRQPRNSLLRARILWLFVDAADRTKLARALRQWEGEAQSVPVLWLPMGAANQLLSRNTQALQWFNRHLREQPDDTLALAAYADALEASGREAAALQLRSRLLNRLRFAETERAPFTERQIWSRLMTAGGSPQQALAGLQRWHDGSVGMLQLWYAAQLARLDSINQEAQKDAWLAWGRARGLREEGYQRIQEALRSNTARRWPRCWLTRRSTTPTGLPRRSVWVTTIRPWPRRCPRSAMSSRCRYVGSCGGSRLPSLSATRRACVSAGGRKTLAA